MSRLAGGLDEVLAQVAKSYVEIRQSTVDSFRIMCEQGVPFEEAVKIAQRAVDKMNPTNQLNREIT